MDTMIMNPEDETSAYLSEEFSQATAQNYAEFIDEDGSAVTDFTPYFALTADGRYYTYVTIGGYGDDEEQILSITDVKATFASPSEMSFGYSKALVERISSRLQSGAEENPEVPAGSKIISADFTTDTVNYLKKAELQVVTSADVEQVVVLDESGNDKKPTQNYEVNEDGSKTRIEGSWFSRGTKLMITGFRRDEQFIPRQYKDSIYKHTVQLIKSVNDDGTLILQSERAGTESEEY